MLAVILSMSFYGCNNKSYNYYIKEGNRVLILKDTTSAISLYSKAIELAPDKAQKAYKNRGACLLALKRYIEAKKDLDNAIKLNENDKDAYSFRYELEEKTSETAAEIEDINKVLTLDSNNILALNTLGAILSESENKEIAIGIFNKIICKDSTYALAHNNLAMILLDNNNLDLAITEYTKAINIDAKQALYYYNRSYAYLVQKKFQLALTDLELANRLEPNDPETLNSLAIAYFGLKKNEDACRSWKKAYDLGYTDAKKNLDKYCK